jgi:glutathione synthase/RimK-type ligase-like ATP-grasp enzyme
MMFQQRFPSCRSLPMSNDLGAAARAAAEAARRAAAEGLAVIDDPDSILKCTNKVYLAQLLERYKIGAPKTLLIHRDNADQVISILGLPCILKQPDGTFSQGVVKVDTVRGLDQQIERMLERSEMIVGQEFLPTEFDWRIGVLDGQPLWVCKYHMAKDHWQIVKRSDRGNAHFGEVEAMPVEEAPRDVVETAVRAANLIGDGLYGVDLKQVRNRNYVIEVNDNPNIDAGFEDAVLKEQLYLRIMESFVRRIEQRASRSHHGERQQKIAAV